MDKDKDPSMDRVEVEVEADMDLDTKRAVRKISALLVNMARMPVLRIEELPS
jgi:hypothetical protein